MTKIPFNCPSPVTGWMPLSPGKPTSCFAIISNNHLACLKINKVSALSHFIPFIIHFQYYNFNPTSDVEEEEKDGK